MNHFKFLLIPALFLLFEILLQISYFRPKN